MTQITESVKRLAGNGNQREIDKTRFETEDGLPQGWIVCKLENVATNVNSGFASGKHNKSGNGIPHIRPMNINYFGNIDLSVVKYVQENFKDKLQKNDVLFNNTNSPKLLGKTALIKENTNWTYSNHMTRIRVNNSRIESSWLAIFLHKLFLDGFYKLIAKNHVNQSSINSMYLTTKIPIIIAPLNEQKRIVAKIESIFTQIDAVKEQLERLVSQTKSVSGSLNALRNSVLKQAFEGKLVPQDPHDEPAEVLLKRIHKDSSKEIIFEKDNLPRGWIKTTIADLGFLVTKGSTPTSYGFSYVPSGINFVKIENIYNNHIKTSSITQFITKETHDYLKRSQLHADDVLFSIAGTIGQVAIVHRDDLPANTNQAISIIRDPLKLLNTKYLSVILQSKPLNILSKARGVGIYNVSLEDIKNTKIPLPPLAEQKRIVAKIESIFTQIDAIEEHVEFTLVLIDRLKNSTLKSAFEGRLVPQDPDDEPAKILLQKIRQEKEIFQKAKSIRRNKRRVK